MKRSVERSIFRNHLKAAIFRIRWYLIGVGDIDRGVIIKRSLMVDKFCARTGLLLRTQSWRQELVNVYLSGSHPILRRNESDLFYLSSEWKALRTKVLRKYGKVCMKCGSRKDIHVDHIKPKSNYPELKLDFDNMQVLCLVCNIQKGNRNEIDYRGSQKINSELIPGRQTSLVAGLESSLLPCGESQGAP